MPIQVEVEGRGILEFPDGTDPAVIQATVKRVVGQPDLTPSHEAGPKDERTWTDTAVDLLPTAGAMAGGILGMAGGPVGAAAGAGIGGAGGEGWRRVIQGIQGRRNLAQDTPASAARDIAIEGGKQAALEAAGGLVGKGLQKVGAATYRGLLKPSKAVRDSFGGDDVVQTLIKERIPISDKGLAKVTGRLGDSRAAALKLVDEADPTSTLVRPEEVIREFRPVVSTLRKRADIGDANELAKAGERGKRLVKTMDRGAGVGARRAQMLKEEAQDAASGAYRMRDRGGAAQVGAEGLLSEATAKGLRKAVESRVPGVAAQNQRTQALLGGTRALEDALERGGNNLTIGGARDLIAAGIGGSLAGPAGLSAGILTRLLSSPSTGSRAAIAADRLGRTRAPQDALRALAALMSSHE